MLRDWPIAMVKITNVAPIRMLALVSAIADSCTWICCAVLTKWIAFGGNSLF
jgi:hypothetical protein